MVLKKIVLWILCLIAFCLISPLVLMLLGLIFDVSFENVVLTGLKVGIIVWIIFIAYNLFSKKRNVSSDNVSEQNS